MNFKAGGILQLEKGSWLKFKKKMQEENNYHNVC